MDIKKMIAGIAAAMIACSAAVIKVNKKKVPGSGYRSDVTSVTTFPESKETEYNKNTVLNIPVTVSETVNETTVQTELQTSEVIAVLSAPETEISSENVSQPETTTPEPEVVPTVQGPVNGECLYDIIYVEYGLPENPAYTGFKAYEPYTSITSKTSRQWQLQQDAITDIKGFRLLDGRYLVALGTYFDAPCGTYVDIMLENGVRIPSIVGDIKSDAHTDEGTHTYSKCMCATEFIVDEKYCPVRDTGNISYVYDEWNSKVECIWVYWKTY